MPSHAYVPGRTPRHAEGAFDVFHASVHGPLEETLAWRAGWHFIEGGFFWEAHEVLEPVWLALPPNAPERRFVQGVIQIANAALKLKMGRARAALRLCGIAEGLLAECAGPTAIMGLDRATVEDYLSGVRREAKSAL
ncbi:MAG: DUF309 domain-containing protein [Pseudooceanicola sp.]|nr:DUF309 domain-containing protein [Pseudooceanicola sp.]